MATCLVILAAGVARLQMAPTGRLLLLGLGVCFTGWFLKGLTLLVIACRQEALST